MVIDTSHFRDGACHSISFDDYPGAFVFFDNDSDELHILGFIQRLRSSEMLVVKEVVDSAS